jgi:hypothetical protein
MLFLLEPVEDDHLIVDDNVATVEQGDQALCLNILPVYALEGVIVYLVP